MKSSKTNLLLMAALIAIQTVTHAKDENSDDKKQPRTWRQAAYDNRYGLAAGSAAVGLSALGYVYGGDFMTWFNSLSPADQAKAQDVIETSVEKDLQVIEEKQEVVAEKIDAKKHGVAQQKAIAKEEQAIAQVQQQVAQKQTWLQYFSNMRANDPALQKIQAGIDAKNTQYAAENSDERSSDIANSDRISDQEKTRYKHQYYENQMNQRNKTYYSKLKKYDKEVYYPELSKARNDLSRRDYISEEREKLENKLQNEVFAPIEPAGAGAGPVNRVLSGDFSEPTKAAQGAYQSIRDYFNPTTPAQELRALGDAHQPTETSKIDDNSNEEDDSWNTSVPTRGSMITNTPAGDPIAETSEIDTENDFWLNNNAPSTTAPMFSTASSDTDTSSQQSAAPNDVPKSTDDLITKSEAVRARYHKSKNQRNNA